MKRPRKKFSCGCGCGRLCFSNELIDVEIVQAMDAEGKHLETTRIPVARACKEAFEIELALQKQLQGVVRRWAPTPKTFLQKANVFRTLRHWWLRIGAAVEIVRCQQSIHERTKGFEWARRHAIQSAVLFGCPRFMQGFMSRRFLARAKRRQAKWKLSNVTLKEHPEPVEVQA